MITDGDKEAYEDAYVELPLFGQHITIDLKEECEIYAIAVWRYFKDWRVYYDVVVRIADDHEFTKNVRTLFNNDTDNSAGFGPGADKHYVESHQGRLIDARGQRARYVQLYSNGNTANDLNHYAEVEVWGRPVADEPVNRAHIMKLLNDLTLEVPWSPVPRELVNQEARREFEGRNRGAAAKIDAIKDRAMGELAGMHDGFVDVLVQELGSRSDASRLANEVVPVLQRIGSQKARAVLLDLALGKYVKNGPTVYAAKQYLASSRHESEARLLLKSNNPDIVRSALLRMKTLDADLMQQLSAILQSQNRSLRIAAADCLAGLAGPADVTAALQEIIGSIETVGEISAADSKDMFAKLGSVADNAAESLAEVISRLAAQDEELLSLIANLSGRPKWCVVLALAQRGSEAVRPELATIASDYSPGSNFRWAAFKLFCSTATEEDKEFLVTVARTDAFRVYLYRDSGNRLSYLEELAGRQIEYHKRGRPAPTVDLTKGIYPFRVLAEHTVRRLDRAKRTVSAEGLVPLPVKIPPPMFVGWPNQFMPLLTEDIPKQMPKLLAPAGTMNVALGAVVTASDELPIIGDLPQVVDGDKTSGDGYYMELGPGPQWIVIDLQRPCEIYWVGLWHYHKLLHRVYYDVVVQVSDNPDFVECVTLFNNDHDGSGGFGEGIDLLYPETHMGKWIEGDGVRGRYVRLHSDGNTAHELNNYCEVEVWGRSVD
ncbi:MAG: hypothetical protein IH624_02715 [Phycisphaerae bacterium]|nr:hypothetical protein [Phycisphaerae bacterium]